MLPLHCKRPRTQLGRGPRGEGREDERRLGTGGGGVVVVKDSDDDDDFQ